MANVAVYNMEGNEVGTLELNDAVFGVEAVSYTHLPVWLSVRRKRQLYRLRLGLMRMWQFPGYPTMSTSAVKPAQRGRL